MTKEWDGRAMAQAPGSPITEDRFYYRGDGETIEDLVMRGGYACRVFLGLRRFGKTSFLKRIERHCNGTNNGWLPEEAKYHGRKAYFIPMGDAAPIPGAIAQALEEEIDGVETKIFLLDDIQSLQAAWDSQDRSLPDIERALRELFDQAEKSNGEKVRIVLAEPTNHREWLGGGQSGSRASRRNRFGGQVHAGPEIFKACGPLLANAYSEITMLDFDEAAGLLCGSPPDMRGREGMRFDLKTEQIQELYTAFGGNPWFLSWVHWELAQRMDLGAANQDRLNIFIGEVTDAISQAQQTGLDSIYEALSTDERLIVQMLHGLWSDHPDAKALFDVANSRRTWTGHASATHGRLGRLGLAETQNGYVTQLTSEVFARTVNEALGGISIFEQPNDIDRELWSKLTNSLHPGDAARSKPVIHQLSDLFFDGSPNGHRYWQKYVSWLGELREKKSAEWPHFIVVCGNLLPGAVENEAVAPQREYQAQLTAAFDRLFEIQRLLRPAEGDTPSSRQIIIVPGVLDINWQLFKRSGADKKEAIKDFYKTRKLWDKMVQEYGFSPAAPKNIEDEDGDSRQVLDPVAFPVQRLIFVPFDTVGIDAIESQLSYEAVADVNEIRRRIRNKFNADWINFISSQEINSPSKKEQEDLIDSWRHFLQYTWRYVIDENDPETMPDPDEKIDETTFRWRQSLRPNERRKGKKDKKVKANSNRAMDWASEAGVVLEEAMTHTEKQLEELDPDRRCLPIAITHHCPQQRRQATLVEFVHSYRFRQKLTRSGVQWVLHGHSSRQQRLTESVAHTHDHSDRGADSSRITLISSGSFSVLPELVPPASMEDLDDRPTRPSFNLIEVLPPDRHTDGEGEFLVSVKFYEWADADDDTPRISR